MDEHLNKATEEFIETRINHHGRNAPESVDAANAELISCVGRLGVTLAPEQTALLKECESAYLLADGESTWHYYKAGFGDAIALLMGWQNRG